MKLQTTTRAAALSAVAGLVALAAAGCTSAPPPEAATMSQGTGAASTAPSAAPSAAGQTPGASPSGGASSSPSAGPTQKSMLDIVKHHNCSTSVFLQEAGLAGGALRTYVGKPAATGTLAPGATGAITQARAAVGFAGARLQHAKDALKGCPATTNSLRSVVGQNVTLLASFKKELAAGTVAPNRGDAAMAMFANVVSQADHLRLKVKEVVPTAAQLGG